MNKTILIDFDGVLHRYSKGWVGGKLYDKPMDGAVNAIKTLIKNGFLPVVFTAREKTSWPLIEKWLKKYHFPKMAITNIKTTALCYLDDRAVRFTNWNDFLKFYV